MLADEPRWVAWRLEERGGKRPGKTTKVPYSPAGGKAKADDPATWGTRAEAEARAASLVNGGDSGGVGIQLGDLGDDTFLAGLDLDTCISADGSFALWAEKILAELDTYAERSPSGTGVKAFFYISREDVRPFLEDLGVVDANQWGIKRSVDGANGGNHGPGVELYCAARYFAVTGDQWPGKPDRITMLDQVNLARLAAAIPASTGHKTKHRGGADNSRSAIAFRKGAALRRAGKTFEEMCEALRRDPEVAEWCRDKGDPNGMRELHRIWEKSNPGNVPEILVLPGKRHEAADHGLAALYVAGVPFYQRGRRLERIACVKAKDASGEVISVPGIIPVIPSIMERALGCNARWAAMRKKEPVTIDPPSSVVEQILGMVGEWRFKPLTGLVQCPTLRRDGSVLDAEGYDERTGLLLTTSFLMPAMPKAPSIEDAQRALATLCELLKEFPFDTEESKAVALSMLITPVCRGAMNVAPIHLLTAPAPGTGKSYLGDCAAMIATGEQLPVESMAAKYEETEKRLVGSLLAGFPIIGIDNCRGTISGDLFCQIAERPIISVRALGSSEKFQIHNTFSMFINGNNTTVAEDLVRRALRCRLDANLEHPELREFKNDPLTMIAADRGKYIASCLTIPRAYFAADRPRRRPVLASYADWCRTVREPLIWLGCADPVATQQTLRTDDPRKAEVAAVFDAWRMIVGVGKQHRRVTKDLIADASQSDDRTLHDAFLAVASTRGQNAVDARTLGRWLARYDGAIAAKSKLYCDRSDPSRLKWYLDFPGK
jgi:putative DNA primase/helicase